MRSQDYTGPELKGYVVRPDDDRSRGVLILPTIFGVNAFARGYANLLAENGMTAAVWDINHGLPPSTEYAECIRRARTLTDEVVAAQVHAWIDELTISMGVRSLGILGFCIGGRFALIAAAEEERIACCVAAYPSTENPRLPNQAKDALALVSEIKRPVQILQPGKDHVTSAETYDQLKAALFARSAPTILQYYPEAEHGFMHRPQPSANVSAAKLASPPVVAFITACLETAT